MPPSSKIQSDLLWVIYFNNPLTDPFAFSFFSSTYFPHHTKVILSKIQILSWWVHPASNSFPLFMAMAFKVIWSPNPNENISKWVKRVPQEYVYLII